MEKRFNPFLTGQVAQSMKMAMSLKRGVKRIWHFNMYLTACLA